MDERDPRFDGDASPAEEAAAARLLEAAGPRPPLPAADLEAIAAAARAAWRAGVEGGGTALQRRPRWHWAAAVAALLLLAAGIGWRVGGWGSRPAPAPPAAAVEAATGPVYLELEGAGARREVRPGESVPAGATLRTAGGEPGTRASLRLASGAVLRLDAGTRLRFAPAGALELAAGAVYADTGPAGAALEVRTTMGSVRDVGTQFAVRLAGPEARALRVRVREGAVVVQPLAAGGGRAYSAAAGQELVLHRDGTLERRAVAGYGPGWSWTMAAAGGFDVEGRSLQELLDWVARETGWGVRFADPELAASARTIVLHGGIGSLRPDQAPFAVLPGAGLEGELRDGVLLLRRSRTPR